MSPLCAAVGAEPETALLCFSKNKHDVENDTKMNAVREFFFFWFFFLWS